MAIGLKCDEAVKEYALLKLQCDSLEDAMGAEDPGRLL